jgi:hypothetical protein
MSTTKVQEKWTLTSFASGKFLSWLE